MTHTPIATSPQSLSRQKVRQLFSQTHGFIHAHALLSSAVALGSLLVGGGLFMHHPAPPTVQPSPISLNSTQEQVDLLHQDGWSYLPGSEIYSDNITITGLDREIVAFDSPIRQVNTAISLYGPVLQHDGDFMVRADLAEIKDSAIMQLYAQPPLIYDEARFDQPTVKLSIIGASLIAEVWEGKSQQPSIEQTFTIQTAPAHSIQLSAQGTTVAISVDEKPVGTLQPKTAIFSGGSVWFGFDTTAAGDSFKVTALLARGSNGSHVDIRDIPAELKAIPLNDQGWQQLAAKTYPTKTIGAAMALGPMVSDSGYSQLALGGWYGSMTTENALKAQFVHPQPDRYSFAEADALVAIAQQHDLAIHGHALVFGEANPKWMVETPAADLEKVMTDHITQVMTHYKGKVASWDVVNEPLGADYFEGPLELRDHIWLKAMGEAYIAKAFATARAADADAKLFINDYGLEADGDRWDGFLVLLENLLKQGVPIDGVGFQTHVYEEGDEVDQSILRQHFDQIAALGKAYSHPLVARISEMDVYGHNTANQTEQFASTLKTCMDSPTCVNFTMWGISETYGSTSWIDDDGELQIGDGLPFDRKYRPLKAVAAMQQVLK